MLNHIPVLGAVATLCLVVLADFKNDKAITKLALQFTVLIAILTLPAYFSGESAEEVVEHLPGVTDSFIEKHEQFAKFALGLTELVGIIGAVGLYWFRKNPGLATKYWRSIQIVALINAIVMLMTANLGGQIRHTEIRNIVQDSQTSSKNHSPTLGYDD